MENNQNFALHSSKTRKYPDIFSISIRWNLELFKRANTISSIIKILIGHKAVKSARKPKSGMAIATLVVAAIVAGHTISIELATAQSPLFPLKNVPIPIQ